MRAKDVMTTNVITVSPDTAVDEVARLLLERRISGVPVVDGTGRLVGIVTEGDLMRRPESGTERRRSWWLTLLADRRASVEEYVKVHGTRAGDVMTRQVVTVTGETSLAEIARLLEEHRIKRVPVVQDGVLIGIVSRANLLQGLAARRAAPPPVALDDRVLRERVMAFLSKQDWAAPLAINVVVSDGVVELWGLVESEDDRRALRVAIEGVPGVKRVEDHLGTVRPWLLGT